MTVKLIGLAAAGVSLFLSSQPSCAGRLDDVKERGILRCGILANSPGHSMLDDRGNWKGFSIDYCRAVAAAVLDDPNKVDFRPAALGQNLASLKSGELDILAATLTYTIGREVDLGYSFIGPTIFSGSTFMVPSNAKIKTIKDLDGATICLQAGSLGEEAIPNYFKANGMTFKSLSVGTLHQLYSMYDSGRCDAVTADKLTLSARRLERPDPAAHAVLEDSYAKSDAGPMVRTGDEAWLNVAKYVFYALVTAEEFNITQKNVDEQRKAESLEVRTFLGAESNLGLKLGLKKDWPVTVLKAVGNYAEIWERNLGKDSPLKLARDENRTRRDGGLLFAPSWR